MPVKGDFDMGNMQVKELDNNESFKDGGRNAVDKEALKDALPSSPETAAESLFPATAQEQSFLRKDKKDLDVPSSDMNL